MGSVDPGLQPRARSAPEERNGSSAVEKEIGEAARAASPDHRPKPLRVARIASLEGGLNMSSKTSTAALDSFRHGSFHFRRRAPRHPAGESVRLSSRHGFSHAATSGHRKTDCHRKFYCHPERSEGPAFSARSSRTMRKQYRGETEITQAQIAVAKEEVMNRSNTNRPSRNTQLICPAQLRITLTLL